MAEKRGKNTLRSFLFPIVIALALLAGAALLLPVYRAKQKKQEEMYRLRQTLEEKQAERNDRARETEALKNSPAAVEKVAREKFRYAREGETLLEYPAPPKPVKKK